MRRSIQLLMLAFVTFNLSANAQNTNTSAQNKASLDGKTFYVMGHDVNHPEKPERDTIQFMNGKMSSNGCKQYGFKMSAYTATTANGKTTFTCVCHSDKEGQISWSGSVDGKNISGTYLWHKEGQNDINYAFSGMQK